ncbi:MAG TPA: AMP-binding protein [Steroidobacteraceae bacterium]|nr:AMP-binding protein [Steroidobacteraceae bacterium]
MEKIWLKSYPPGVPAEIDLRGTKSLKEIFERSFETYRDQPAYINMGTALSYGDIDRLSAQLGAWLQQKAGLKKGDRVALMMPNLLQYPIAIVAALRVGLTIVNTNPLYTARELEHQLTDSGAIAIVVLENFVHVLQGVIAQTDVKHVIVTGVGDLLGAPKSLLVNFVVRHVRKQVPKFAIPGVVRFNDVLSGARNLKLTPVEVGHEDIAFLQYTGGTTGISKGAVLTHRNMVANVMQAHAWLATGTPKEKNVVITALPLYHIFSLTANCLVFMQSGAKNVLITNPRDFRAFVAELKKYPFTYISGVNTLFNALLNTPGFDSVDFSSLRVTLGGGMAVQKAVAERWKKVTGHVLTQAWGLTETSPAACINPFDIQEFNGSIGLPISSTEVSIRDDEGHELGLNEVGEICVRGPQVMRGYWNRADETAKVMIPGGWLRTGDVGRMDERGFVYIEDRKKDMILVSGFNVYPNEVESVVVTHPGVLEAAAVAQPDARAGEVVALFVVKRDATLTAEALIEHCRASLTGYKVPRHIYFRTELPKTNVGKIMRRTLRDELNRT